MGFRDSVMYILKTVFYITIYSAMLLLAVYLVPNVIIPLVKKFSILGHIPIYGELTIYGGVFLVVVAIILMIHPDNMKRGK